MSEADEPLPLCLEHPFQLWSYSKSHRMLVLRGRPGEDYDHYVDVIFTSVVGLKLASSYKKLVVDVAADASEMDDFLQAPDRYERGFMNLEVSDETHKGFVVCKRFMVRRGIGWQDSLP
jgi:hypothetical protein